MDSILTSIKKLLGMDADYTAFDTDVIIHINTALAILCQLGVGPDKGFRIRDDSATWQDFVGDDARAEEVVIIVDEAHHIVVEVQQRGA